VSGALGNVWSYDFRDYEVLYYCVVHSSWKVGGEGGVLFFIIFLCGVVRGGQEVVICCNKSVVIEEI